MKLILLFLLQFTASVTGAQVKVQRVQLENLPKAIHEPYANNAVKWTDSSGIVHYLVTSHKPAIYSSIGLSDMSGNTYGNIRYRQSKEDPSSYTYYFTVTNDTARFHWKEYGATKKCDTRTPANKVVNKFELTDLNKDGNLEIWLIFKAVCPDDTAGTGLSILFFDQGKKSSLQGTTKSKVQLIDVLGDQNFKAQPQIVKDYAFWLWRRFVKPE